MEERSSRESSNHISLNRRTKYFRFIQLILCFICLILAIFFWTSVYSLTVTTVVIFATSLSFFIITLIDVIAGMSRNQYTITAWVGIAFLAAFMFFLSFGFLVYTSSFLVATVVFLITAIIFLIDGILIIIHLFKFHSTKRVHPIMDDKVEEREKQSDELALDEYVQTDSTEPINEVPAQMRTYAPRTAAPTKKSSHGSSFPITTYGGTFPMGGRDEAPLPTPDNLTGLEPSRSSQIHVTRRSTREASLDDRGIGTEDVSTQKPSIYEGSLLYPPLEEEIVEKSTYVPVESTRPMTLETYEQSETSSLGREAQSTKKPSKRTSELDQEVTMCRRAQEDVQTETNWSYNPDDMQGRTVRPCQASGEPMLQQPLGVFTIGSRHQEYQRRNCPSQVCQCCNRDQTTRDQVTPFVSHHYDQSPCICGYTHYQASTVVRGAVRQCPQDSVCQQQKMIQEQLEQTRQVYGPHVCGCHEQPSANTKLLQSRKVSQDCSLTENTELSIYNTKETENEFSNVSLLDAKIKNLAVTTTANKNNASPVSIGVETSSAVEDDELGLLFSGESGKRVTIAEIPTSSSQGSTAREYETWLKKMRQNENQYMKQPDEQHKRYAESRKNMRKYSSSEDEKSTADKICTHICNRRRESEEETSNPDRTPTVLRLSKGFNSSFENEGGAETIRKKYISPSLVASNTISNLQIMEDTSQSSPTPSSEYTDRSSSRRNHGLPCVRRCWETPKRESIMKSLYWEEGTPQTGTTFGNINNLKTWGTEITTTTTVRTTNFGPDNEDPVSVCARSEETSYTSSKSPAPALDMDSSSEDRSYIAREIVKQNRTNLLRSSRPAKRSTYSQDKKESRALGDDEDFRCFVPCCTLPSLSDENDSVEPMVEERTEFQELQTKVASTVSASVPADEVELRRRSILKNRRQIDEEIREELALDDIEPTLEEIEEIEDPADDLTVGEEKKVRGDVERRIVERKSTLEQIEELVEQENTEEFESISAKWSKVPMRQLKREEVTETRDARPLHEAVFQDKMVMQKMTCGCICECLCRNAQLAAFRESQRTRNKSFDIGRYNVTSLNELPYHPRDDYKLTNKTFEKSLGRTDSPISDNYSNVSDYFWENPIQPNRTSRVPEGFKTPKSSARREEVLPKILDENFYQSRRRSLEKSLPSSESLTRKTSIENEQHNRTKEGRDDDSYNGETSSVPKRGPVKRLHPDRK